MWNLSHYNTVIHRYPVTFSKIQTSLPKVILCIDFIIRDIFLHSNLSLNNALYMHIKGAHIKPLSDLLKTLYRKFRNNDL